MVMLRAAVLSLFACGFAIGATAMPIAVDSLEHAGRVGSQLGGTTTAILAADGSGFAVAIGAKAGLAKSPAGDLQLERSRSTDGRNLQLNSLAQLDAPY